MFSSNNPTLTPAVFSNSVDSFGSGFRERSNTMTVQGAVNASMILLSACVATAGLSYWWLGTTPGAMFPAFFGSMILGIILALVMFFKPQTSPFVAPAYALVEGVWVGAISLLYASMINPKTQAITGSGIVFQAASLTFAIFFALLFLYKARVIQATPNFVRGLMVASLGVFAFFLVTLVLWLCGVNMAWLSMGPIAIGISAIIVVIAAANLIIDFAVIEEGAEQGAPKYMEWYAAFGLLVTLVWLYASILRLLAIINRK